MARPLESVPALTARKRRKPEAVRAAELEAVAPLRLRVRGVSATPVPPLAEFAPYGEVLVGYVYEVEAVPEGTYAGKRILVFHPASIGRELQELPDIEPTRRHILSLVPLDEKSPWATVGQADASGSFDLVPHMLVSDQARHPDYSIGHEACCGP